LAKEEIAMKREELLELFKGMEIEGIEDIVGKIVDMNGKEINKKQKTIEDTIAKYKDYDDLKSKIDTYEKGQLNDQEKLEKALKEAQEIMSSIDFTTPINPLAIPPKEAIKITDTDLIDYDSNLAAQQKDEVLEKWSQIVD
jgi:hypothetical protein